MKLLLLILALCLLEATGSRVVATALGPLRLPAYPFTSALTAEIVQSNAAKLQERIQRNFFTPSRPQSNLAGHTVGSPLIVGGAEANPGKFPWQVNIRMDDLYFCGGSVIDKDWILTAGHCVVGLEKFVVTAGTVKSTPSQIEEPWRQTITTSESYLHPRYDDEFVDNDIGLLKLPQALSYTDFVRPVRLPSHSMATLFLEGQRAVVSGWGKTSDDPYGRISPILMYVDLPVVSNKVCEKIYGNVMIDTKLCCSTAEIKSTCNGDSGGPLVLKEKSDDTYTLIGIVSFGAQDGCSKKFPVAFTRITSFLRFIEYVTNIQIRD